MTITEFLLARISEDEATASLLSKGDAGHSPGTEVYTGTEWVTTPLTTDRLLAECKAKRAIIEHAQEATEVEKEYDDYEWQGTVSRSEPWTGDAILLSLAAVYKDHTDYDPEWTPA